MSNVTDKRLSFRPYRQVLESVQTQFDLIRYSLKIIKPKDRKQFIKQIKDKKLADIGKSRTLLDSQSMEAKADYFEKYFGVSFGKPDEIEELKEIMRRRNEISHEIYEPPKSQDEMLKMAIEKRKEQPLVSDSMLKRARHFFYWIPQTCIECGGKTYQSYFKQY
jgi:hypothetical protein